MGNRRILSVPEITLDDPRSATVTNPGMPDVPDQDSIPEPPVSQQAIQGIPPMLARPPQAQAARAAAKPKMAKVVAPGQAQTPSSPVLQGSGGDTSGSTTPDFDAFVAQRAKQIADLKQAQGTADESRRWQDIANGFVRAGDVASGRKTDEGALQQRLENTQKPVQNVLQQQETGRAATGEAAAQVGLSGKMWDQRMAVQAADPNSSLSQRTQGFLASTGLFPPGSEKFISAADYEKALQAGSQGIHALTLKAQIAHQNAELQLGKDKLGEETRNHDLEHEAAMYRMQTAIPPQQQTEVEALIGGARSLGDLSAAHDNASLLDKAESYFGMGNYDATKKAAAPEIAKGNAKGRVNPSGEIRERSSLPNFGPGSGSQIEQRRQSMLRDADAKLRELEHNRRADPAHVAELRAQYNEIAGGGSAGPAAPTHYLTNRAQGIRIAADANGNPIPGAKPEKIPDGG